MNYPNKITYFKFLVAIAYRKLMCCCYGYVMYCLLLKHEVKLTFSNICNTKLLNRIPFKTNIYKYF